MSSPYEGSNLTFGVELEFLVYYLVAPQPGSDDGGASGDSQGSNASSQSHSSDYSLDGNTELIDLNEKEINDSVPDPHDLRPGALDPSYRAEPWAATKITDLLLNAVPGISIVTPRGQEPREVRTNWDPANPADSPASKGIYLDGNQAWSITTDGSVEDSKTVVPSHPGGFLWKQMGLELVSPAMRDTEEAYIHIREVVKALTTPKQLAIRINHTAGFHVHVGNGAGRFPRSAINRAAALTWAADGLMSYAHPPERGWNQHVPSVREASFLAQQLLNPIPEIGFNPIRIPRELSPPEQYICLPKSLDREYKARAYNRFPALRQKKMNKGALTRWTESGLKQTWDNLNPPPYLKQEREQSELLRGVSYLMASPTDKDAARLLKCIWRENGPSRTNYNFRFYLSKKAMEPLANFSSEENTFPDDEFDLPDRTTIEFREATASLNPHWIMVWASICVGFFRTAKYATNKHFWTLIHRLNSAEQRPGSYDMVDFLGDMGMPGAARFIEIKLRGLKKVGFNAFSRPVGNPRATAFWYPCRPLYHVKKEEEEEEVVVVT
ncbi:hypothetical protein QBC38DRAFT_473623 [Podospora fimiseda]|uniref:Amidoligase enzyme n=1 Tax=Podospora fimiseda TaxID=252190 RepID=A0AAN7BT52_9PEZI|nr:hypothetical protein QBC38DRAFT_473623 [Podospora fimiseda]